jgi:hypothetical protein
MLPQKSNIGVFGIGSVDFGEEGFGGYMVQLDLFGC